MQNNPATADSAFLVIRNPPSKRHERERNLQAIRINRSIGPSVCIDSYHALRDHLLLRRFTKSPISVRIGGRAHRLPPSNPSHEVRKTHKIRQGRFTPLTCQTSLNRVCFIYVQPTEYLTMKNLIALLMVCSLALVASVRAENDNPKKKKGNGGANAAAPATQANPKQHQGKNANGPGGGPHNNLRKGRQGDGQVQTQANIQTDAKIRGNGNGKHHGDAKNNGAVNANANADANAANNLKGNKGNKADKLDKHAAKQLAHNSPEFKAKQQKFQSIHAQHANFKAKQNASIASVKFNKNFKIQGSQNWKGQKYVVFQNYHPQWHDQIWWHSHHDHIVLVGGGWYFWNSGYWYPAWGYSEAEAYYPYDGPIYVGHNPAPPDQIIADVQASLQEQGFYKGEVDGLLGPLTRAALAEYQQSQGLETTAAMDEPTLESLGMS